MQNPLERFDGGAGVGQAKRKASTEPKPTVDLSTCEPNTVGRSFVWTEGLFLLDANKNPVCTCCRQRVAAGNGTCRNTTNLIHHYGSVRADAEHARRLEDARRRQAQVLVAAPKGKAPALAKGPTKKKKSETSGLGRLASRVFEDLFNWQIMAQQPVDTPVHPLLRKAFRTATGNPRFDYGDREFFRKSLMKKRAVATDTLREMLKGTRPAVTIDTWTSDSDRGLMAVNVHFIETSDAAWVLRKGTCACEVFDRSSSSARVGAKLMGALAGLGIERSVVSVTCDAASDVRDAVQRHTPASIAWVGCAARKIKRTVQRYLSDPALKKTLAVLNRAAAHLNESAALAAAKSASAAAPVGKGQKASVGRKQKAPKEIPLGCATRWQSWRGLIEACLDLRMGLAPTIETGGISITDEDWRNAEEMLETLEPFHEAAQTLDGDITLPLVPCVMGVLSSHVKASGAAFTAGAGSGEIFLGDRVDRLGGVPDAVTIAAVLSPRTKGLEWLDDAERLAWREVVVRAMKELLRADIKREREACELLSLAGVDGSSGSRDADADAAAAATAAAAAATAAGGEDTNGRTPKKRKISWVTMCVKTQKGGGTDAAGGDGGAGGGSGNGGSGMGDGGDPLGNRGAGASSEVLASDLSLRMRVEGGRSELAHFVAAAGLDDEDSNAEETELEWWCRNQFAFPTLARLAAVYLAIPASAAASERALSAAGSVTRVGQQGGGQPGSRLAETLVFLRGSHGLAWSSGRSDEELGVVVIEDD